MALPKRQDRLAGRSALVDDIPFTMPVNSLDSPALMAAFTCDADAAQKLLAGEELQIVRLPRNRGLLVVTVIDYRTTDIGPYVEFSVALGVTQGASRKPLLSTVLFQKRSGTGQYVWDLPVSSKVSVKGGRGIWGMPKHQASLDFRVEDHQMSSQYDLDGELCMRITVNRSRLRVPLKHFAAVNYCAFRGMLFKSYIYFTDKAEVAVGPLAHAQLLLGPHKRMDPLRNLDLNDRPLFTATLPHSHGVLDDHFEAWFLTSEKVIDITDPPEGLEQVYGLPKDESWLSPPTAAGR
jgi:Acetoacetate decarboxylase (ADC)